MERHALGWSVTLPVSIQWSFFGESEVPWEGLIREEEARGVEYTYKSTNIIDGAT